MSSNIANTVPYMTTSRKMTTNDPITLERDLVSMYDEISNAVNLREIGIFDLAQVVTGQQWFNDGPQTTNAPQKRQALRQVYNIAPTGGIAAGTTFTTAHGISNITAFTHIYGTCITNIPDFRPLPFASAIIVTDQISLRCTATNIIIEVGATSPNITTAIVVLEFLLQ